MSIQVYLWKKNPGAFELLSFTSVQEVLGLWNTVRRPDSEDQIWIDFNDVDSRMLAAQSKEFDLEMDGLRDLQSETPFPRMHSFRSYDFVILHRLFYDFERQQCEHRGVAFFRGDRFLITVHRNHLSRLFEHVGSLVRGHPEAFLGKGNARVFLHLLEGLVADYGPILNRWQEELEEIEESILRGSQDPVTERILKFKKLVVTLRKALIPERQTLVQIYERTQLGDSEESVRPFLKDVSEEVSNLLRELEGLSFQAASVFDMYAANLTLDMSKASHQMNAIMQRLSVVSAIFMPLTFIVGLYGMNIEGIPELHWPGFYYFLLGFMALIVALLLILFKKLKWY